MSALFFKPIPFETVWGGTSIKRYYGYDWMPDKTGQAWAFAVQPKGSNVCLSAPYAGKTLGQLWEQAPELFGGATDREFPVIISMLCPQDDLSIQVHPDADHARELGYACGKNEAWYFLEAEPDSAIVFGHNAVDEADLRSYVAHDGWDSLIRHLSVRPDDFVYIEAGTLHACCKNVIVYEVQQSTDVTYRFYDYGRVDDAGNKRELHLEQAIGCLSYDEGRNHVSYTAEAEAYGGCVRTCYHRSDSFVIEKLVVTDDEYILDGSTYELVNVVRGEGAVDGTAVRVGDNFLAPAGQRTAISGNLTCMMTTA